MKGATWTPGFWTLDCDDTCQICDPPPEEHTDRQARYAEQDAEAATIDALMGDTE